MRLSLDPEQRVDHTLLDSDRSHSEKLLDLFDGAGRGVAGDEDEPDSSDGSVAGADAFRQLVSASQLLINTRREKQNWTV